MNIYTITTRNEIRVFMKTTAEQGDTIVSCFHPYAAVVAESRKEASEIFIKAFHLRNTEPLVIHKRGDSDLPTGAYNEWVWDEKRRRMVDMNTLNSDDITRMSTMNLYFVEVNRDDIAYRSGEREPEIISAAIYAPTRGKARSLFCKRYGTDWTAPIRVLLIYKNINAEPSIADDDTVDECLYLLYERGVL